MTQLALLGRGAVLIRWSDKLLDQAATVALKHLDKAGAVGVRFNPLQRHRRFTLRASRPADAAELDDIGWSNGVRHGGTRSGRAKCSDRLGCCRAGVVSRA